MKREFSHLIRKFAVRGKAVINDATVEDAYFTGLNELVPVIFNGDGAHRAVKIVQMILGKRFIM